MEMTILEIFEMCNLICCFFLKMSKGKEFMLTMRFQHFIISALQAGVMLCLKKQQHYDHKVSRPFSQQTFLHVIAEKAPVLLTTLMMDLFHIYPQVLGSHDSEPACAIPVS